MNANKIYFLDAPVEQSELTFESQLFDAIAVSNHLIASALQEFQIDNNKQFWENVISLSKHWGYLITGKKGSGKSACGELFLEYFYDHGYLCFDLWGSVIDRENLFWCIPKAGKFGKAYPILIVGPHYAHYEIPEEMRYLIKVVDEKTPLAEIIKIAATEKRVVCLDNSSFESGHAKEILLDWFKKLPHLIYHTRLDNEVELVDENNRKVQTKKLKAAILLREVHNIMPSTTQAAEDEETKKIKSVLINFMREARHARTSIIVDEQRYMDVQKSFRELINMRVLKQSEIESLNNVEELEWFIREQVNYYTVGFAHNVVNYPNATYNYFPPIPSLRADQFFAIDTSYGSPRFYKRHHVPLPHFRHCSEYDDFEDLTKVRIHVDMIKMTKGEDFNFNAWSLKVIAEFKKDVSQPFKVMENIGWTLGYRAFLRFLKDMHDMGFLGKRKKDGEYIFSLAQLPEMKKMDNIDYKLKLLKEQYPEWGCRKLANHLKSYFGVSRHYTVIEKRMNRLIKTGVIKLTKQVAAKPTPPLHNPIISPS